MKNKGIITTFYSYKGGVGRTMALANIASLLALWGKKVLCIDGDIEAPGLNYYLEPKERSQFGFIDILLSYQSENKIDWRKALSKPNIKSGYNLDNIQMILVEGKDKQFSPNSQNLNWEELYVKHGFALSLEKLCEEWRDNFDHILIDSRTGITQVSGVLTIQVPDQLLLFCTANNQGLDGISELSKHIQEERMNLPLDRPTLPIVPIITSFAGRFEKDLGEVWINRFVTNLEFLFEDWLQEGISPLQMTNALKIPYVPRWSFGEELPVLEESGDDADDISYSLMNISALIANRLDNSARFIKNRKDYIVDTKEGASIESQVTTREISHDYQLAVEKSVVMISSTVKDLPEYRTMVMDACLRADTFPKMVEDLPALDSDAIEVSLAMVDESNIYIGIFAHKYGYIPDGHDISITEMEYNRAMERKIPLLIFIISDEVPVRPKDFDKGRAAEQLESLKEKLKKNKFVSFFESPNNLRGLVIDSLSDLKKQREADKEEKKDQGEAWAKSLHYTSEIPKKPEAFVAQNG